MLDLLKTRRSIRKYQAREVEKSKIEVILNSVLLSPTSKGKRPWEFIAITDKELLENLSKCREKSSIFLSEAALGIVVLADPEVSDVWIEDTSIAATIIELTAHSLDLGCCWIQIRKRFHSDNEKAEDYIKRILNIPDKYNIECIVSIGYPAEEKKAYDKDQLPYNKIHYNYFNK